MLHVEALTAKFLCFLVFHFSQIFLNRRLVHKTQGPSAEAERSQGHFGDSGFRVVYVSYIAIWARYKNIFLKHIFGDHAIYSETTVMSLACEG